MSLHQTISVLAACLVTLSPLDSWYSVERNAGGAGILDGAITRVGSVSPSLVLGIIAGSARGINSQTYKPSPLAAQNDPSRHDPCAASVFFFLKYPFAITPAKGCDQIVVSQALGCNKA